MTPDNSACGCSWRHNAGMPAAAGGAPPQPPGHPQVTHLDAGRVIDCPGCWPGPALSSKGGGARQPGAAPQALVAPTIGTSVCSGRPCRASRQQRHLQCRLKDSLWLLMINTAGLLQGNHSTPVGQPCQHHDRQPSGESGGGGVRRRGHSSNTNHSPSRNLPAWPAAVSPHSAVG